MRADQLLLQRGLATSRSQAQRLIAAGVLWCADAGVQAAAGSPAWKRIGKNSDELPVDAVIDLLDAAEARFVSRGGLKLEGALSQSAVSVTGKTCLDLGQSTGGFTDCLLQRGAKLVVGVDVGSGQLHPTLRANPQVLAVEQLNARELNAIDLIANYEDWTSARGMFDSENEENEPFDARFDLIVGDLSFISQTLVLPAAVPLLKPGGDLLMLVKPQFELQPGQVGKGGIVKDPQLYAVVEERIRDCCKTLGLKVTGWFDSPITGGDGNVEFFVHAVAPKING